MFLDQAPVRLIGLVALIGSLRMRDLAKALPYAAATVLGAVYIFGAWRAAVDLRAISAHWLFFALAITWVGDIAAYYVGRAVGRRKLAPRISPGKSWEGALGSLAGALVFGYGFYRLVQPPQSLPVVLFLSAVANAAGQVGDLAESAIKRGAGVKDSGTLLPGHGGFLDRLDSSLFSMPAVYYSLRYTILFLTK
jgi:phosphatidate cytidylyltransferase